MKKYSVLLSGGVDNNANRKCYKNDLAYTYKVLVDKLGYEKEDIFVLYADGSNICYEGIEIEALYADKVGLINVLKCIDFKEDDQLFILVSNHGGDDYNGNIALWGNGEYISLEEFSNVINDIFCRKIVVLGQCFGGNILNYSLHETCVITANDKGMQTFSRPFKRNQEPDYDEFIYHFISYFNGQYPDGTNLKVGVHDNDVNSAYQYAWENDTFNAKSPKYNSLIGGCAPISEIPQMKNTIQTDNIISL